MIDDDVFAETERAARPNPMEAIVIRVVCRDCKTSAVMPFLEWVETGCDVRPTALEDFVEQHRGHRTY